MTAYAIRYDIPPPAPRQRRIDARHREPDSDLSRALQAMEVDGYIEVTTFTEYVGLRNRFHAFKPRRFCLREVDAGKLWRCWRIE